MCLCIGVLLLHMALYVLGLKSVVSWVWQIEFVVPILCSLIPLLADLFWPPHFVVSCLFLFWVQWNLPDWSTGGHWGSCLWASKTKCSIWASELFVLSLSLLGPTSMPPVSSMWGLRSLSSLVSCSSMVSGHHSVGFICSAVWLILVSWVPWVQSWVVNALDHHSCCSKLWCAEHLCKL